jgi:hypothetical protein
MILVPAGLFGDDMVDEKMNVVIVTAMSQISDRPSDVMAFLLTTEAHSIISTHNFSTKF